MYNYNNPSEDFYNKQLEGIRKLNAKKEEVINCNKLIGEGGYNQIFTNDNGKYVVFNQKTQQDKKLQTRKNFNKALANALLSAGGRNTLKYGLTNNGKVYTKSKRDLIDMANTKQDNNLLNIAISIQHGRSDHHNNISNNQDELPTYELLYPLPQLLLLGMIDRKPDNTVIKYTKKGFVKCYDIDHDDIDWTHIPGCENIEKNHLFNCDGFWREQNILKYLGKLDERSKKDKDFKNKIATLIKNFTLTKKKMEYVIKYTTMQSYYLGLSKEEIKSFLQEDLRRYFTYLKKLKECNNYWPFMKEYIEEFCKESQETLLSFSKENLDKVLDDVFKQDDLKKQIAEIVNKRLGKPANKQKKLCWDREGKDGKLINDISGPEYVGKINDKWDRLLANNKISYTDKLNSLKSFVEKLNEKETSDCYLF